MISPTEATLPDIFTSPSTTRAGVLITPYFMMDGMSSTLTRSALVPLSYKAFFTLS